MGRRRVLATAYACQPGLGSEAGIGWNWVRQIARRHDCWLITRENNVDAIRTRARAEGLAGLTVQGFDLPRWARFWKRGPRGALPYFYLWQLALTAEARRLDRQVGFGVVHHLTFASSWIPSGLAPLDRPFVWGPVGQHPRVPDRFLSPAALRWRAAEWGKAAGRRTLARFDPLVRRTLERADRILSLGSEFEGRLPARHRAKLVAMLAAGIEPWPLPDDRFRRHGPLRVLYAGRLVDLKGVRLALEAFAHLAAHDERATFDLLGAGRLRGVIEARLAELGLGDRVRLHGERPHAETLEHMARADLFLFPSFEGAGMVVPEAMAAGCPVVCLAVGGPGEMVGPDRGLTVAVEATFADTARGLGAALVHLATHEDERVRLARTAHAWALTEAAWEAKGERLEEIYADAVAHHGRRSAGLEPARDAGEAA